MTLVEKLKIHARSPIANYTKLLQNYKFEETSFHIFYEGDDDKSFYTNYIENYLKNEHKVFYYNCKNKDGVYNNYAKINWTKYIKSRVLFFVDKDHSDFIKERRLVESNIFVTKYYSIENYIVNENILNRILTELLNIEDSETVDQILNSFAVQLQIFVQQMLIITSWILYHRLQNNKPNLNNINLSDIFHIKPDLRIKRKALPKNKKLIKYLDQVTSVKTNSNCWKDLLQLCKMLVNINNYKVHLRGKFELWFLVKYSNQLPTLLNASRLKGDKKYKYKTTICIDNAVSIMAPRLIIPNDIEKFLDDNIFNHIS